MGLILMSYEKVKVIESVKMRMMQTKKLKGIGGKFDPTQARVEKIMDRLVEHTNLI